MLGITHEGSRIGVILSGQEGSVSLVGRVYRTTDRTKGAAGQIKVITDNGGERVWIENLHSPHNGRQVLRRRLLSRDYERVAVPSTNGASADEGVWVQPPTFDGPEFAERLKRWMRSEGVSVDQLVQRSGLAHGTIALMRRGTPSSHAAGKGQKVYVPSVNTLAQIAHGLGLQVGYVASWGGLASGGDRWENFSDSERLAIALAIGAETDDAAAMDQAVAGLKRTL